MEQVIAERTELPHSLEKPRHTSTVRLPDIIAGDAIVKLGMHTDSTLTLLRTLSELPPGEASQVRIEGRILTLEQKDLLQRHPAYRFFMSSRLVRSSTGELSLALPTDLNARNENMSAWLQNEFSPSSLASEIGYKVGYFDAQTLVANWLALGRPNDLLPLIGGINQFTIGSDTLPQQTLDRIKALLEEAFVEQERQTRIPNIPKSSPFTLITLQSLNLKEFVYNKNIIKKYPKNPNFLNEFIKKDF